MAGVKSSQVYLPSPDQSATTGAIYTAATTVTAPTDARSALGTGWTSGGYIDENGISLSISKSVTAIKDWSQSVVRKALTDYDGTIACAFLQMDEFAAKSIFGDSNVVKTAANATHGEQLKISIGADLPEIKSYCWNMKDENRRVRVYAPKAQVTELGDVTFVPGSGNVYPATISTYDDGTGHSIYVFYDDGEVVSG